MKERKESKKKVIAIEILVDLFFLGMLILCLTVPTQNDKSYGDIEKVTIIIFVILYLVVIILIDIILIKPLLIAYNDKEECKKSERIVEDNLSTGRYVEVIPIKSIAYEDFILGLTDIAEFYAIINDKEEVEIKVKFEGEEKYRPLETIYQGYFSQYFKLKQEED